MNCFDYWVFGLNSCGSCTNKCLWLVMVRIFSWVNLWNVFIQRMKVFAPLPWLHERNKKSQRHLIGGYSIRRCARLYFGIQYEGVLYCCVYWYNAWCGLACNSKKKDRMHRHSSNQMTRIHLENARWGLKRGSKVKFSFEIQRERILKESGEKIYKLTLT